MAGVGATSLDALLEEIKFRRRREEGMRGGGIVVGGGFSVNHNTTYWTDLFVRHFLFQTEYEVDRDDLLFFIRKNLPGGRPGQFSVEVFRRDSRKLPIGDPDVDWEETIYLNLIVHQVHVVMQALVYIMTDSQSSLTSSLSKRLNGSSKID